MTPQPAIVSNERPDPTPDLAEASRFGLKADSHACGLATRSDGESTITVVILPKFWRPVDTTPQFVWDAHDDKLVVSIYENQSCTVFLTGSEPDQNKRREKLIYDLIQQVENTVSKTEGQEKPLFKLVAPKDYKSSATVPDSTTEQLLNLLFMVHKTLPEEIPTAPDGTLTQQDVLTPLIQWAFVDEVKQQIHSLRRGYVSTTDTLSVIRGRVDVVSAAMADQGLRQSVVCHFDAFTEHTPLLRVLVTALEVVCGGDWRQVLGDGGPLGHALRDEATGLRRVLSSVIPYTRSQALLAARGIRFHRLNRRFERSIRLAVQVIAGSASDASTSGEAYTGGWIWSVDMSKLWERTLQQAFDTNRSDGERIEYYDQQKSSSLLRSGTRDEQQPGVVRAPWINKGGLRKPDLLAVKKDKGWVIDAKYKGTSAKPGELASPGAGDQNQMFVYAHLVGFKTHPFAFIALAYPHQSTEGVASQGPCSLHPSYLAGETPPVGPKLVQFYLPFPQPTDLNTVEAWQRYLTRAGTQLHLRMGECLTTK